MGSDWQQRQPSTFEPGGFENVAPAHVDALPPHEIGAAEDQGSP
jgi:hypothetical protein